VLDHRLLAFLAVAALLTITPGPDMALVTRNAFRGMRSVVHTALGVVTGLLVWGTASAAGVAAVLAASATAFTLLKIVGAAYVCWLGLQTLRAANRHGTVPAGSARARGGPPYRQGLLSNLLNPKIAVFYTTFLPQFIGPGQSVLARSLLLAALHALMGLAWLVAYGYSIHRAGNLVARPAVRRFLDRLTGTVLVGFGLRLATISR
jgi:threonine/homoserine/homoserine lactone efflux protein